MQAGHHMSKHSVRSIDIYDFDRVDQLLIGWQTHTARQLVIHEDAARRLIVFHYVLGVPATILAAFAGTAAVAGLQEAMGTWGLVGAGLATASSILVGLQTLLNFGGRAEAHRQSAASYKRLIRRLELVPPQSTRLEEIDREGFLYKEIQQLERDIGDTDSASPLPPRGVTNELEGVEIRLRHEVEVVVDVSERTVTGGVERTHS